MVDCLCQCHTSQKQKFAWLITYYNTGVINIVTMCISGENVGVLPEVQCGSACCSFVRSIVSFFLTAVGLEPRTYRLEICRATIAQQGITENIQLYNYIMNIHKFLLLFLVSNISYMNSAF